jgi:hypothetical protein
MKNFLDKLERLAGNWIETMDNQLQQPIADTMTGAVFINPIRLEDQVVEEQHAEQPAEQPITPAPSPLRQPNTSEKDTTAHKRVLREAR